jgi:hypothetical protein
MARIARFLIAVGLLAGCGGDDFGGDDSLGHDESPVGSLQRLFAAEPAAPRSTHATTRRARAVLPNSELLDGPDRFVINPFDDTEFVVERTALDNSTQDSTEWRGELKGDVGGVATLTSVDGVLAGAVYAGSRVFEVGTGTDNVQEVRELEPTAFGPEDDPDVDASAPLPDATGSAVEGDSAAISADGVVIDVMVLWTPAARIAKGGTVSAIQSTVAAAVANANTAYVNSGVPAQLRLVYSGEVNYTQSSSSLTDLGALTSTSDGKLDEVHTLRNQYGADVVTLIGTWTDACGYGYMMPAPSVNYASYAFNVVALNCAVGNLSYAHEVGHNEGLNHDPDNASGTPAYPYAYGYHDPGGAFRTVMAYPYLSAPRIPYLSSPNHFYNGKVTGVANKQDNALALTNTCATVASFRTTVSPPNSGTGTGLSAQYFDNSDLTAPKVARTDATVNFDWGAGSPDPSIGADTFSVRWTGQVEATTTATYTFYTVSDDGVRLWVNGQLLINNWTNHGATENSGTIALTAGQKYDVKMEFFDGGGGAVAKLLWSAPTIAKQVIPKSQLYPAGAAAGTGLTGQYFDNADFTTLKVTRADPVVSFNWGSGSPAASIGPDTFSVRWTGKIRAPASATYTLYTVSDDGVRLWVNGQLIINNWTNHGPTENSGTIALTAGQNYDVKMEYFEGGGGSVAKLLWSNATMAKQTIPQSVLYP